MNNLLTTQQQRLQGAILQGGAAPAGLLSEASAPQLAVYQHAYRARLSAALRDNYEVLYRALGDADFDALALAYIDAHPSEHASIRWFGARLADFMSTGRADLHPALADLARMDWALRAAFDAADAPALGLAVLQDLAPQDWPALRLALHPSVLRLPLAWAVEPGWRALRRYEPATGEDAPVLDEPQPHAHALLVWREGLETRWRSLDADEARLLDAAARGDSVAALGELAVAAAGAEAAPTLLLRCLQQWFAEGLVGALLRSDA